MAKLRLAHKTRRSVPGPDHLDPKGNPHQSPGDSYYLATFLRQTPLDSHHDGGPIQLGWGLRSHMTERTGSDHFLAVTGLVSVPIPETVTDTESPSTIGPTPAGVPVRMTSPGRRVITAEIHSMIFGMS